MKSASPHKQADNDNRYAVTLAIEFKDVDIANNYQSPEGAKRLDDMSWEVTVYVIDKEIFKTCVDWKYGDTTKKWDAYNTELASE